jgi:hypothetical protein
MKHFLVLPVLLLLLFASLARADDAAPSYVELADAPTITVDWSKGATQAVNLHGNRTFVFQNGVKGRDYRLIIKQDAVGSRTVTWPASVHWTGSEQINPAATLTTTANKKDYLSFFYDGAVYDALSISQDH